MQKSHKKVAPTVQQRKAASTMQQRKTAPVRAQTRHIATVQNAKAPTRHNIKQMQKRKMATGGDPYDVVIVGGGPGGYVAAIKAAQLGLKTACVEMRGSLGGTCLNVGCIPSKALLNATHTLEHVKHVGAKVGIKGTDGLSVDFDTLMKEKVNVVTGLTKGIEGLFRKNKVDYIQGKGKITGDNEVSVDLVAGGQQKVNTKNIIIATGSEPSVIPGVQVDEERIVTSTGALSLKSIPKKMIVIGAGVIGLELGSVYKRLGSEVVVVGNMDRITPGVDTEIATTFQKSLAKQGFQFKLGNNVRAVVRKGDEVEVTIADKDNNTSTLQADVVLLSTGRRPYTQGLGLEEQGIAMDRAQVKIDDHWRTNKPNIFAIGDVVAGPMLAHKAEEEGVAVVEQIAGKHGHVNYNTIPGVIYTHPEVATVGKTEDELKEAGADYKVGKFPMMANSRARANLDTDGLVKILTDAKTDRILGAHIVGANAGELIAELVLAMEYGASSEDVARTCHAHPTLSEATKEAALAAHFKPIHM